MLIVLAAGIGCAAFSEYVTPATIDPQAVAYAASAGVADANSFKGYANLEKAIRLEVAVQNAYEVKTLAIEQLQQKNQLDYGILQGVVARNTQIARDREVELFGEQGILSLGLTALGFGGFTGLLGLMRRRPGDITPQEMEQAVTTVKGELTTKDRQILEIVKGVQKLLTTYPKGTPIGDELRANLSIQSVDTRQTVATIKATI